MPLTLQILQGQFTVHRLPAGSEAPAQVWESDFLTVSKTDDEVSIVCRAGIPLPAEQSVDGWSCFKVLGPLDFSLTGVLASLATCLADAGVSIFAISTYDTDYILVKSDRLATATRALATAGYLIVEM
jgi:hypothetical protein